MRTELIKRGQKIADEHTTNSMESFFIVAKTTKEEDDYCLEKTKEFGENIIINVLRLYESS